MTIGEYKKERVLVGTFLLVSCKSKSHILVVHRIVRPRKSPGEFIGKPAKIRLVVSRLWCYTTGFSRGHWRKAKDIPWDHPGILGFVDLPPGAERPPRV